MLKNNNTENKIVNLYVNGKSVRVNQSDSVLDAINLSGTLIPQLCKDPDMKPIGACRTCLVQIDGIKGFPASCSTPISDGMSISTSSTELDEVRKGVLELTAGMLPMGDVKKDYMEFSTVLSSYDNLEPELPTRERQNVDSSNPIFNLAMESCILCGRCAQACQDGHQFIGAIDVLGTGGNTRIGTFMDKPLIDSVCTTCGQCLLKC